MNLKRASIRNEILIRRYLSMLNSISHATLQVSFGIETQSGFIQNHYITLIMYNFLTLYNYDHMGNH